MDKRTQRPTAEQVAWVFRHLLDHFEDGGSFRHLIYDRLGFGPESYQTLYEAGGMLLTNIAEQYRKYKDYLREIEEWEQTSLEDLINTVIQSEKKPVNTFKAKLVYKGELNRTLNDLMEEEGEKE